MRSLRTAVIGVVLAAVAATAACGGNNGGSTSDTSGGNTAAVSTAPAAGSDTGKVNDTPVCTLIKSTDIQKFVKKPIVAFDDNNLSVGKDANYCEYLTDADTFDNLTVYRIYKKDGTWESQTSQSGTHFKLSGYDAWQGDGEDHEVIMVHLPGDVIAFVQDAGAGLDDAALHAATEYVVERMLSK